MAGCGDDEVGGVDVYENQVRPKRSTKPASCNGDDEPIGSHNRQGYKAPSHRAFPKRPKTFGVAVIGCSGDLANACGRHGGASCCDITSWPYCEEYHETHSKMFPHLIAFCEIKLPANSPWRMTPLRTSVCARYPQVLGCAGPQTYAGREMHCSCKDGRHERDGFGDFVGSERLLVRLWCLAAGLDLSRARRVSTALSRIRNRFERAKLLSLQMLLLMKTTVAQMTPDTALSK